MLFLKVLTSIYFVAGSEPGSGDSGVNESKMAAIGLWSGAVTPTG